MACSATGFFIILRTPQPLTHTLLLKFKSMWSGTHTPYKVLRCDMHENRADLCLASFFSQHAFGTICRITSNSLHVMDRRLSSVNFEGTEGPFWFLARLLFDSKIHWKIRVPNVPVVFPASGWGIYLGCNQFHVYVCRVPSGSCAALVFIPPWLMQAACSFNTLHWQPSTNFRTSHPIVL